MNSSNPSGLLLIDKPLGISSFDIIRRLRAQTGWRKFGHAGTLDPAATGLMIILVGQATKWSSDLLKQNKSYQAELIFGTTSATGDSEGPLTTISDRQPTPLEIEATLAQFRGPIIQTPPAHSAIKVGGQRAYKLARAGESVIMPQRQVEIYDLRLINYGYPHATVSAEVSSGTYVRTLAADIGRTIGVGAYLGALRRTSIGPYHLSEAHQLDQITADNFNNLLMNLRQT